MTLFKVSNNPYIPALDSFNTDTLDITIEGTKYSVPSSFIILFDNSIIFRRNSEVIKLDTNRITVSTINMLIKGKYQHAEIEHFKKRVISDIIYVLLGKYIIISTSGLKSGLGRENIIVDDYVQADSTILFLVYPRDVYPAKYSILFYNTNANRIIWEFLTGIIRTSRQRIQYFRDVIYLTDDSSGINVFNIRNETKGYWPLPGRVVSMFRSKNTLYAILSNRMVYRLEYQNDNSVKTSSLANLFIGISILNIVGMDLGAASEKYIIMRFSIPDPIFSEAEARKEYTFDTNQSQLVIADLGQNSYKLVPIDVIEAEIARKFIQNAPRDLTFDIRDEDRYKIKHIGYDSAGFIFDRTNSPLFYMFGPSIYTNNSSWIAELIPTNEGASVVGDLKWVESPGQYPMIFNPPSD